MSNVSAQAAASLLGDMLSELPVGVQAFFQAQQNGISLDFNKNNGDIQVFNQETWYLNI